MGLRFIIGYEQGTEDLGPQHEIAVLWDSVTETAFGHTFRGSEDGKYSALETGQKFLDWCETKQNIDRGDVRALSVTEVYRLQDDFASAQGDANA